MLALRDYQDFAVDSMWSYWTRNNGNPLVCMPTGTGKSLVIAGFCRKALWEYSHTNILVLTHVKELIEQNFEKLVEYWPGAPAGVFSAGLRRKDVGRQITFAGIGSIHKYDAWFAPNLILIDEAHMVSPSEKTTYQKFIRALLRRNPKLKIAGLSATPYRLGQGMLTEPGGLFTDVCVDMTGLDAFNWFLDQGYLKPLLPKPGHVDFDISDVAIMNNGEFNLKALQEAVDKDVLTRAAVDELLTFGHGENRKHWLIFAGGVKHARNITRMLAESGISAAVVHSHSKEFPFSNDERDEAVKAFKAGQVQALVNNGVFTTGFDFPGIDMIGCLRHTTSPGLWVQMLGRGTRPNYVRQGYNLSTREGRLGSIAALTPNCRVLDFAHNSDRLGPINDPKKPKSRKKKDDEKPGDIPIKMCPVLACSAYNHSTARFCAECGHEFAFKPKFEESSSEGVLIAKSKPKKEPQEVQQHWFDVAEVSYSSMIPHNAKTPGRFGVPPYMLRVTYNCGLRAFTERIRLEHPEGTALTIAREWWKKRTDVPVPETVAEAMPHCCKLAKPKRIRVWVNQVKPTILYHEF